MKDWNKIKIKNENRLFINILNNTQFFFLSLFVLFFVFFVFFFLKIKK
jgi:hypothetical protein